MEEIQDILVRTQRRNEDDARRFEALDPEQCMACHAYGADKRSLTISCGYDVSEVIPDVISLRLVEELRDRGWYLLVCKSCRAALLRLLGVWWNGRVSLRAVPKDHDGGMLDECADDLITALAPGRQEVTAPTCARTEAALASLERVTRVDKEQAEASPDPFAHPVGETIVELGHYEGGDEVPF